MNTFARAVAPDPACAVSGAAHPHGGSNPFLIAWEPGHYYSPVPAMEEVKRREARIFAVPRTLAGVDLREAFQLQLLQDFGRYYADQPFVERKTEGLRYFFENPNFRHGEAVILYSMMRHASPRRIIEIGSGYSSCAMLDTNALFFDNAIRCVFVKPYSTLLRSLLHDGDTAKIDILEKPVQDVDLDLFATLSDGDILFIDSSHVCKIDSDVNHLVFNVLPCLKTGVLVHFHDICYPFEYPKEWTYQRRAWNEAYPLRAFLQYNSAYEIVCFNSFLGCFYREV